MKNISKVNNIFKKINKNIKLIEKEVVKIASFARSTMVNRTRKSGVDLYNRKFKEYSKRYKKIKPFIAYNAYKNTKVNLSFTGDMLSRGLSITKVKNGAKVYFVDEKSKKKARNNERLERIFFGISNKEHKEIQKRLKKVWKI